MRALIKDVNEMAVGTPLWAVDKYGAVFSASVVTGKSAAFPRSILAVDKDGRPLRRVTGGTFYTKPSEAMAVSKGILNDARDKLDRIESAARKIIEAARATV